MSKKNINSENQLLNNLPLSEYQRLLPHLQEVMLVSGSVLHEPYDAINYAYFPVSAMISLVSIMEDGSTTKIGLIGNEGMIGVPIFLA
ncbi:Crp/Fnr family transcriptional regulator [Cyanobacterium aponinum]|uniref:Crp/Fnr family transcriptional regulator n=1 Tax=Cyanobacterium aponinum (strain PCC 10605) TaxID=755178 RepID=K9Z5X9_CYAAP|nr:Crp/Fnr family transcriptional regulator [Cyanobacterium aponinum]AFZ53788.1 hypothetical protein Cyan10605_1685 [Cyanobacterium aponinum PCC 10605]